MVKQIECDALSDVRITFAWLLLIRWDLVDAVKVSWRNERTPVASVSSHVWQRQVWSHQFVLCARLTMVADNSFYEVSRLSLYNQWINIRTANFEVDDYFICTWILWQPACKVSSISIDILYFLKWSFDRCLTRVSSARCIWQRSSKWPTSHIIGWLWIDVRRPHHMLNFPMRSQVFGPVQPERQAC